MKQELVPSSSHSVIKRSEIPKYLVLLQDALAIKFVQENKKQGPDQSVSTTPQEEEERTDESLKGIVLFKEFLSANEPCTVWNNKLKTCLSQLEYRGIILPSTLLVGVTLSLEDPLEPLFIVKDAFAKKVLRSPSGCKIEFIGEIEEILADPALPRNFIPLSDSICWAIHDLTSSGQEAFVDVILRELSNSYPDTVPPPKEILYQVLEALTKAEKVYQTPKGYFIKGGVKEVLNVPCEDKSAIVSINSFKRSNSLRNSIKKYSGVTGCLPRRTFSLRSKPKIPKELLKSSISPVSSRRGSSSDLSLSKESIVYEKRQKHKFFLKNLLSFRRSTSSVTNQNEIDNGEDATHLDESSKEMSTQTSISLENLRENLGLLSVSSGNGSANTSQTPSPSFSGKERSQDSDSGRFTESSEPDGKPQSLLLTQSDPPSTGVRPPSSMGSKDDEEISRLMSPTPTPSTSTYSTSAAYLFDNPYRRRYLNYLGTGASSYKSMSLPSSANPSPLPHYPPRRFEKKQIYERLHSVKQIETKKIVARPSYPQLSPVPVSSMLTVPSSSSSNVQVEVLVPLGKLINKVLTDFGDKNDKDVVQKTAEDEQESNVAPKTVNDLFTFKSSVHANTCTNTIKSQVDVDVEFKARQMPLVTKSCVPKASSASAVETVSFKPIVLVGAKDCRESEII